VKKFSKTQNKKNITKNQQIICFQHHQTLTTFTSANNLTFYICAQDILFEATKCLLQYFYFTYNHMKERSKLSSSQMNRFHLRLHSPLISNSGIFFHPLKVFVTLLVQEGRCERLRRGLIGLSFSFSPTIPHCQSPS